MSTDKAVTTFERTEQEAGFGEAVFRTLLEHTVGVHHTQLYGRQAGHNHQRDIVLVLFGSWVLHQPVSMSPGKGVGRASKVVDLEKGEPDFLACVAPWTKIENGYLFSRRTVVEKNLEDLSFIALSGDHFQGVGAKRRCRTSTGQAAYSAQCVRVPSVESAGQQGTQSF